MLKLRPHIHLWHLNPNLPLLCAAMNISLTPPFFLLPTSHPLPDANRSFGCGGREGLIYHLFRLLLVKLPQPQDLLYLGNVSGLLVILV